MALCLFDRCDYVQMRVRLICVRQTPKRTFTYYKWTTDSDWWDRYCADPVLASQD